ncbi:MAG: RNA 2',3'-cyclic phosphodiesterase [Flavobacteriales bacterium]|nr:RNA 2',3'-cyclic phosphodiesterase [Flavobacteriales bacterium]
MTFSPVKAPETLRLFAAIPPPQEMLWIQKKFQDHLNRGDWKWMRTENLHLTLCFVGNIRSEALPGLLESWEKVRWQFTPFRIWSDGPAWMPERKPRMLWWRYKKSQEFSNLHKALHRAAAPFKIRPSAWEPHPWPHITLARFKGSRQGPGWLPEVDACPDYLEINEIQIWQSLLHQGQVRYVPLPNRFPLFDA